MKRSVLVGACVIVLCVVGALLFVGQTKISPQAISSSVNREPHLIARAWQLPVATSFKRHIMFQSNASLCGPASVANANRSVGARAASEAEVLSGTGRCWSGYCILGLTLDELADVARSSSGRKVTVLRDLTAAEFRAHMTQANDPRRRYIVNFSRDRIFGAGVGHHSPIGGYLEDENLVLVLDVNREFGAWLVAPSRLFAAVDTFDGKRKRGLLLME
jgi:hypothetical protein